jgi:hypothetical protein
LTNARNSASNICAVLNFTAELHVDRSIHGLGDFIQTHAVGTLNLLESVRAYCIALADDERPTIHFCLFLPMKCLARSPRMMRHSNRSGNDRRYEID